MAIRAKLTQQGQAGASSASTGASRKEHTEEEKAKRKDRVQKAKDALARSAQLKGDHVAPARATLKLFLQRLQEPNQPDDNTFEAMVEAPFKAPPKRTKDGPRRNF